MLTSNIDPLVIAGLILAGGLVLGILFDRILLSRLKKFAEKTKWQGDEIIIHSLKGMSVIWFALAAAYFALRYIPFSEFWARHVQKGLKVVTILTFTVFVSRTIAGMIRLNTQKISQRVPVASIFTTVTHAVIYSIGFLIMLQSLGISITPLLTALGVGGIAVALALQDTLTNLFAGFHILASRNIRRGDFVKLDNGEVGYITDIDWRVTTVNSSDHLVVIPNLKVVQSVVTNYSLPDAKVALTVPVLVSYNGDLKKVEEITLHTAEEVAAEVEGCSKEDEPLVRFTRFDDSGISLNLTLKVNSYNDLVPVRSELIKRLHLRYRENGIELPYPTRTVLMKSNYKPSQK